MLIISNAHRAKCSLNLKSKYIPNFWIFHAPFFIDVEKVDYQHFGRIFHSILTLSHLLDRNLNDNFIFKYFFSLGKVFFLNWKYFFIKFLNSKLPSQLFSSNSQEKGWILRKDEWRQNYHGMSEDQTLNL